MFHNTPKDSFVPRNTYMDLMIYFSSNEKPMTRTEMDKFWDSCTLSQKHHYMCADISEGRTEGAVVLNDHVPQPNQDGGSHSLMGVSESYTTSVWDD
jgi:hypothetical protein